MYPTTTYVCVVLLIYLSLLIVSGQLAVRSIQDMAKLFLQFTIPSLPGREKAGPELQKPLTPSFLRIYVL